MKGNDYIMKTSEKAWQLINKYFRYLSSSDESENDVPSSLELISVIRRSDEEKSEIMIRSMI